MTLQINFLEQQQGSRSTPVLSYFNAEMGDNFVSVGHGSCGKTTLAVMQLCRRLENATCDRFDCFTARLLTCDSLVLCVFFSRG